MEGVDPAAAEHPDDVMMVFSGAGSTNDPPGGAGLDGATGGGSAGSDDVTDGASSNDPRIP